MCFGRSDAHLTIALHYSSLCTDRKPAGGHGKPVWTLYYPSSPAKLYQIKDGQEAKGASTKPLPQGKNIHLH